MKTVLVVDDEHGITDALSDLLSEEGYHVIVANNGKEGFERIAEQRPDLILLDYMMPVMDGREMLTRLHESDEYREIPVVMMSAIPRSSVRVERSPNSFLRKPFEVDALLAELQRLLTPRDED